MPTCRAGKAQQPAGSGAQRGIIRRSALWVTSWMVAYYGKDFAGQAIDRANPPTFESQATFLERHKLLLPGERRRLTAADFAPEAIDRQ
jgi:hypothetical protein